MPILTLHLSLSLVNNAMRVRTVGIASAKGGFSTVTKKWGGGGIRSLELEPVGRDG